MTLIAPLSFSHFLEVARRESHAEHEAYEEEGRIPPDDQLRLGIAAGPLTAQRLPNRNGESAWQFDALPGLPFDAGKLDLTSEVAVKSFGEVMTIRAGTEGIQLAKKSGPPPFEASTTKHIPEGPLVLFRSWMNFAKGVVDCLEKHVAAAALPQHWPQLPLAQNPRATRAPTQSAFDHALAACLNPAYPAFSVKGPPGTGKTNLLATVAIALARQGKRVAIVSVAHAAVDNALKQVSALLAAQARRDATLPALHLVKHGAPGRDGLPAEVKVCKLKHAEPWHIFGTTAAAAVYMFDHARCFNHRPLDVLLLDEAGQVAACAAAALSKLAPRVILFGDEDQLPPIPKAVHEPGSFGDASAMEYFARVAGEGWVLPLEVTHRLNRSICELVQRHFYPVIPLAPDTNADSAVLVAGVRQPALRLVDCPHRGPKLSRSAEEVERIVLLVREALGRTVSLGDELSTLTTPRPLRQTDIAILTPFRSQVAAIQAALLHHGWTEITKVGTVDKLQGQGAALVIYSLAASSPDYIGAQAEWLYSPNRWNVALSRAKAQCIVVGHLSAQHLVAPAVLDGIGAHRRIIRLLEDPIWNRET
jgi:hypothetical protein